MGWQQYSLCYCNLYCCGADFSFSSFISTALIALALETVIMSLAFVWNKQSCCLHFSKRRTSSFNPTHKCVSIITHKRKCVCVHSIHFLIPSQKYFLTGSERTLFWGLLYFQKSIFKRLLNFFLSKNDLFQMSSGYEDGKQSCWCKCMKFRVQPSMNSPDSNTET